MGPGPSMVAPRVYAAMAKPIVGYLDPYCLEIIGDIQQMLRVAFGTKNEFTIPVSGTGSAGMEAAVANFTEPGAKVAVFANGFFSDRLTEMARRQGGNVVRFEKPWGEVYGDQEAARFHPPREAAGRGLCASGNFHGRVSGRQGHLPGRA